MFRSVRFAVLSLGLGLPVTAAAQHLSLTPHIGVYIPTEQLYQAVTGATKDDFKLEVGPSFGGRLGLWFGDRFGIEAGGSYVPTTFRVAGTGGGAPVKQDAKLFLGTGQAVLFLVPRTSLLSVYVSGGVGVVSRGGVAFTSQASTSDVGATFGAGLGLRLAGVMLTAGADLMSYNAKYQGAQVVSASAVRQKDVSVRLGLGVPFGGGRSRQGG